MSTIKRWLFGVAGVAILGVLALLLLPEGGKETPTPVKERKRPDRTEVLKDTINGHEWVDLGLPSGLKWASCNVGASKPEEFGDYYAWGETEPKDDYSTINSLTYKVSFRALKKSGIVDESGILTKQHDAANAVWGGTWRMPTDEEYQELISSCKWIFASFNGVNGYLVTGPNEKNIFLPAAAFRQDMTIENVGEFGDYWSATIVKELSGVSCSLGYSSKSYGRRRYARYAGRTIRAVTD
ncbi:MAG: hypothetical protein K2H22_02325 [Muribaculaceae bacterium]|nr:hypothetical protein [Muribaculaceae bacterium]